MPQARSGRPKRIPQLRAPTDDPLLAVIEKYKREFDAALRPYDYLE